MVVIAIVAADIRFGPFLVSLQAWEKKNDCMHVGQLTPHI
jgi:hypothetical protein